MQKLFQLHKRGLLTGLLFLVFIWSLFSVRWNHHVFHPGGLTAIGEILHGLIHPALSSDIIRLAIVSTWKTLAYAVAGMTLAILIALIFGVLASGVLVYNRGRRTFTMTLFRAVLGFMRAIHELVWGWLFVTAIGLSPFAAIFAIAIPYGGILGRIFADMLNDVPKEPISTLKSNGASRFHLLCYGYFPIAAADMLSYTMYRFECAVRSSAIMSFIGLGGLGFQIQLSLDDLKYNEVWTFMFFLIGVVLLVDLWSQLLRKRLVQ